MELVIKGVLGACIAVAIHYATTGKNAYLAGLAGAAPIFAWFVHITLASAAKTGDLQSTAQFHLLALIPNSIYLLIVCWLVVRLNAWTALLVAVSVWSVLVFVVVVAWNKGTLFVLDAVLTKFNMALVVIALVGAFLVSVVRKGWPDWLTADYFLGQKRERAVSMLLVGLIATTIGTTLLSVPLMSDHYKRLPGEDRACLLLESALVLGSGNPVAEQVKHNVLTSYLSLAKDARSSGNEKRAAVYSRRAQSVLVGSWAQMGESKPQFC